MRPSRRVPRRRLAIVATGAVSFLMLLPVLLLGLRIYGGSFVGDLEAENGKVVELDDPYTGTPGDPVNPLLEPYGEHPLVCVYLLVRGVTIDELTLDASAHVSVTLSMFEQLQEAMSQGAYRRGTTVVISFEDRLGLEDVKLAVPLSSLLDAGPSGPECPTSGSTADAWTSAVQLPVFGQPRAYPSDEYQLTSYVTASVDVLGTGPANACCPNVAVLVASGNEDWRVQVVQTEVRSDAFVPLDIGAERPRVVRWYTYEVALVPLALTALLLFQLVRDSRASRVAHAHEIILGVAAVLVAVLPLRQVLVPEGAGGLTMVDVLFGFEIVLLLLVVVWLLWLLPPPAGATAERRRRPRDLRAGARVAGSRGRGIT